MKRLLAMALICALLPLAALASGFFPAMDDLFGVTMPDISNAVGREADSVEETVSGTVYTYSPFLVADYDAFDAYVSAAGLTVGSHTVEDNVLTTTLSKDGESLVFEYSYTGRSASLTYPENTRLELEAHPAPEGTQGTLPDIRRIFGAAIPDLSGVLSLHPNARTVRENSTDMIRYTEVSIQDYGRINTHLTALGCAAVEWHADDGVLFATMSYGSGAFTIRYDMQAQTFTIICPELYFDEGVKKAEIAADAELALPSPMQALGAILPRISTALLRYPSSTETTEDSYTEVYENFSADDYSAFSAYLVDKGCTVVGYERDRAGVLRIALSVGDVGFTFNYDQVGHRGEAVYPIGAQLEPEFAASAAATPVPIVTATPAPVVTPAPTAAPVNYTAADCWGIAERYFYNLSWRNPSSVTIHSHWYSSSDGGYVFYIDYPAQNGFGGYNRETYMIKVNWTTGRIQFAYSF